MFFIFLLLLLAGCSQKIHDTFESLPVGSYTIDKESFSQLPDCATPLIINFFKRKGFLIETINLKETRKKALPHRYTLKAKFSMEKQASEKVACLKVLLENRSSKSNNALVTIKRTFDPLVPLETNIRLMVTALDHKLPIVTHSGSATSTFEYGPVSL